MAWTAPRTWVTGEIVTAALMNTHLRDNERYLKGLDGIVQIQDGLELTGTGTASYLKTPVLTTTQRDAIVSPANGMVIFNSTDAKLQKYEGTWRSDMAYGGTLTYLMVASQAQGDVFYADTGTSIARLAAGTVGQYLKTQGAGANPAWQSGVGMDNLAAAKTPVASGWVAAPGSLGSLTDELFLTFTTAGTGTGTAETNGLNQVQIDLGTTYLVNGIYTKVGIWLSEADTVSCSVRVGTSGDLTDSTVGTASGVLASEGTRTVQLSTLQAVRYITYRIWGAVGTAYFKGYDVLAYGKGIAV